jgi:hypothetical protein
LKETDNVETGKHTRVFICIWGGNYCSYYNIHRYL